MIQKEQEIGVLYSYARTGGTILNKCLSAMENNWVLSEVNPVFSVTPVAEQLSKWFGLPGVAPNLAPYIKQVLRAKEFAVENNKNLVVRDWSHMDFVGFPWVKPTYQSSQQRELSLYFDLKEVALVRHPFDVFNSVNQKTSVNGLLYFPAFLKTYDAYTKFAAEVGFVRYEDFCKDPETVVKDVCSRLNVEYDAAFLDNWHKQTNINGDPDTRSEVAPHSYERSPVNSKIYHKILERLGYEE